MAVCMGSTAWLFMLLFDLEGFYLRPLSVVCISALLVVSAYSYFVFTFLELLDCLLYGLFLCDFLGLLYSRFLNDLAGLLVDDLDLVSGNTLLDSFPCDCDFLLACFSLSQLYLSRSVLDLIALSLGFFLSRYSRISFLLSLCLRCLGRVSFFLSLCLRTLRCAFF